MSQAGSQAAAFYREVADTGVLWTIRDEAGFPAPLTTGGKRAQPFWSSCSRAEKIVKTVAAYRGFEPVAVSWQEFCEDWVPGLARDGFLVRVNWSGPRAIGYDLEPEELAEIVRIRMEQGEMEQPGNA